VSNELSMAEREAIAALLKQGWSKRRIARELELHRDTVRRYARELGQPERGTVEDVATGAGSKPTTPFKVAAGNDAAAPLDCGTDPSRTGRSRCEPYRTIIEEKISAGLTAQRIFQDLTTDHGYSGAYNAVKRIVRRLNGSTEAPFRRIEREPGAEAQADFGKGAALIGPDGRRRSSHVLRVSLSYSRKGYSEAFFKQDTPSWLAGWENAFWSWGGVPKVLQIDNTKAAVNKADWYDPELHPIITSFCKHYGTVLMPIKVRTPRHNGKAESNVGYVKCNALKGRTFPTLLAENEHLLRWESQIADLRIHGTTKKQVRRLFEIEKSALLPLPSERFAFFHEEQRVVHRDGHVEVAKAYYSVPPEYMGHTVWARWDSHVVRILNSRFEQIAMHARHEIGKFSTSPQHLASRKIALVEQGATELLRRARLVGPQTGRWAEAVLKERSIEGVRVLAGLLSLVKRHSSSAVERACGLACAHGTFRLKTLRALLKDPVEQDEFRFMDEHPLIRNLNHYGTLVRVQFN
jgi:transposase